MAFSFLTWRVERRSLGRRHGQLIELNDLVDDGSGRMAKTEMPLIQGYFFTNESSKRLGKGTFEDGQG
jgi:hypothetical protein